MNWIKNAHNSTLVNSPTFTPKVGFTGNGSTMYINNNFNPKSQESNFAYNDATVVWMQSTLSTLTGRYVLGANDTVAPAYRACLLYYTTGNDRMYFQSASYNGNVNCQAGKQIGYTRIAGSLQGYVDGEASGAATAGLLEGDIVDLEMLELCVNANGAPAGYNNGDIMFSFYGKGLTTTQMLALYTRIKYYFDNVGGTF